jgi:hypothetical protein
MINPSATAVFPVGRLLLVIAATSAALAVLTTVVKTGGLVDSETYKGVIL